MFEFGSMMDVIVKNGSFSRTAKAVQELFWVIVGLVLLRPSQIYEKERKKRKMAIYSCRI